MKRCLLLAISAPLVFCTAVSAADTKTTSTVTTVKRTPRRALVPPPPPNSVMTIRPTTQATTSVPASPDTSSKDLIVGSGGPYTFNGSSNQRFSGLFNFDNDDPKVPLTLNVDVSTPNSFRWLRVYMGNRLIATEKDFRSKNNIKLDLTGTDGGTQQIVVQGSGARGAAVNWKASSVMTVQLDQVNPDEACPGDAISLRGNNFSISPTRNQVIIGKMNLPVYSATNTELKVKIPVKNFETGELPVYVTVDGVRSKAGKILVRGIPELTGTNYDGIPPGAELYIFGKNFSKKLNENQVFFENTPGQVVSCTPTELVVIVPNFYMGGGSAALSGQVGIPIKVKVGKVESKNTIPITIGNSRWQSPGFRGGPETETVPVGF
ncbi:MAG: IPT/TIG domain-containing protein [Candidatus Obscuribacterales bacterium]|nr:IPT/TIG domain-containing protein [Candidatus Obscuribacterales bacterium]